MKTIPGECPNCGSTTSQLIDNNEAYESGTYTDYLKCEDCGAEWKEYFKYSSYELIEKQKEK